MRELLLTIIYVVCQVLTFAVIIRAVLSWFSIRPDNPLMSLLYLITEPILAPLRRIIPMMGMFDITPIVAIILLQVINWFFVALLS